MNHVTGFSFVLIALFIFLFAILLPIVVFSIYQRLGKIIRLLTEQNEYLHISTNALLDLASEVRDSVGNTTVNQKSQMSSQRY